MSAEMTTEALDKIEAMLPDILRRCALVLADPRSESGQTSTDLAHAVQAMAPLVAEVRRLTDALAAADARLRDMGSREEDLEAEIERLGGVEAGVEERVKAARVDGARGMRDHIADHFTGTAGAPASIARSAVVREIRALDPATVGSGS